MQGYERFQADICAPATLVIKRLQADPEASARLLENLLLDHPATAVAPHEFPASDEYTMSVFRGFVEIDDSYRSLLDFELYSARFPFRHTSITRSRYFRFLIGGYLQEVYILRARLSAFPKTLAKYWRKNSTKSKLFRRLQADLKSCMDQSLSALLGARHSSVHDCRYSDPALLRLSILELLSRDSPEGRWKAWNDRAYRNTRKKWLKFIHSYNLQFEGVLDSYFTLWHPILFEPDGTLIIPPAV